MMWRSQSARNLPCVLFPDHEITGSRSGVGLSRPSKSREADKKMEFDCLMERERERESNQRRRTREG
ncbi:unnamed protein product [Musa acuminata subsp. burmannicoides]